MLPKSPRLRLDPISYKELCRRVMERDSWRCQNCGSPQNLQVHHQQMRSHQGRDEDSNLITLCAGYAVCSRHPGCCPESFQGHVSLAIAVSQPSHLSRTFRYLPCFFDPL
jgi:hypothetical protein